jgi:NitT/TauT family transport system permease protein
MGAAQRRQPQAWGCIHERRRAVPRRSLLPLWGQRSGDSRKRGGAYMTRVAMLRVLIIAAGFALLELLCRTGIVPAFTFPPPSSIAVSALSILASGRYASDLQVTLGNVAASIASAMIVGIIAATIVHALPAVRRVLEPLFATYYAIPMFAFYPLLIVLFGLGNLPQVAIGFLLGVMAVVINTLNGLDRVPRVFDKVARALRLGSGSTAWRIRLPYASPYVFTGFKLAVAYSFVGVIGAEFITSSRGVGYQIAFAYNNFDNNTMYALIALVLTIVIAVNMTLHAWEQRLLARRRG